MTELTFTILKYGFVIALWLFAWMAVRSLHRDITSFLPSSKRSRAKRKHSKNAVMVGAGDAEGGRTPPVHVAQNIREPRSVTNEMPTGPIQPLHSMATTPADDEGTEGIAARAAGAAGSGAEPTLLIVIDGPLAGATVPLTGQPITLGRGTSNTVVLDDEFVSSSHARVSLDPHTHQWMIEDLNSTNGTFVNESRINGIMTLAPRIPVRIGATTFELR
ncbi:MAG: FHA domain-containing protein [Bifidobacteriaceae bacterium]|jgi:hypothetical protein|nr:FHA domain-containing protein [Bifidobacteriaceae bacterium]MCI1979204.1 FHA domain-containing protein [Bifidobacteriaceae bacterium]